MDKKFIIANWKMQFVPSRAEKTAEKILFLLKKEKIDQDKTEIVLSPSFAALEKLSSKIERSPIKLAAQDCFWENKGAFTGEVSSSELKELGVKYVIIGHSERRKIFKETGEMIHKKIKAVLTAGLIPIVCVGETFGERQKGIKDYVIINQISEAFEGIELNPKQEVLIAYEPVWVIGTGQAIESEEAHYMIQVIRQRMIDLIEPSSVDKIVHFIYGGSVDESNIKNFVAGNICGSLVGGASLKASQFVNLIKNIV